MQEMIRTERGNQVLALEETRTHPIIVPLSPSLQTESTNAAQRHSDTQVFVAMWTCTQ